MEQPARYSKNPLNLYPFCEKASAESPLEWSKWAAILEVGMFAKNEIEVRNLLRNKPELVEAAEPMSKVKITGETYAQKKNRDVRNQEKRVGWKNREQKARKKGVLCNSFSWDEVDAKVRSNFFPCVSSEGQRQTIPTEETKPRPAYCHHERLYDVLEVVFVTTRILAFERYNFICKQQKKTESLAPNRKQKNRDVRNQEKRVGWKNREEKVRKKECCVIHSPGMRRMRKSAVIFFHASAQSGNDRQVQQKRLNLNLHHVTTKDFMTVLEAVFVTTKILAFERFNFICRKQKKTESIAQLPAD